jgi:hypothetical protein
MRLFLAYLRFHGNIVRVFGAVALVALALAIVLALRNAPAGLILLGDAGAARLTASTEAVPYLAPPQPRPIASARLSDERGITTHLPPSDEYRAPLLAALNCARAQAGQPALDEEPELSREAVALWRAMVARPDVSPSELIDGKYAFVIVLPLSLADVQSSEAIAGASEAQVALCSLGGMDLSTLDLTGLSTVGVAVFADPRPEDGLDDSSAIIIAR